jgi:chromosomal replication initiation ATPase DnaA
MKRKLSYSLPQIGRKLGNRDHTTILGVIRKIEEKRVSDPNFAGEIREEQTVQKVS